LSSAADEGLYTRSLYHAIEAFLWFFQWKQEIKHLS
jgi:hypothetical protein